MCSNFRHYANQIDNSAMHGNMECMNYPRLIFAIIEVCNIVASN